MAETLPPFAEYLSAAEISEMRARILEIAEAAHEQRLVLLLGAGFSKDARQFPVGSDLALTFLMKTYGCAAELARPVAETYELAAVAQHYCEKSTGERSQLEQALKELLQVEGRESDAEKNLAAIVSICRLQQIFTTNFDKLIEKCLSGRALEVEPTPDGLRNFDREAADADYTGVFHLNGTLDNPKITEDDLREHRSLFVEVLRHELLSKVFVMIGYSFRDDALVKTFGEVFDLLRRIRQERKSYIVMPISKNWVEYKVASLVWQARCKVILLPLTAGAFLQELADAVRNITVKRITREIEESSGIPQGEIEQTVEDLERLFQDLRRDDVARVMERLMSARAS